MKTLIFLCAFFALFSAGCRKDQPPVLSIICIMDGHGGGNCTLADGTRVYRTPSEMVGYWATTETDQANFASWCYKVPPKTTQQAMKLLKQKIGIPEPETFDAIVPEEAPDGSSEN